MKNSEVETPIFWSQQYIFDCFAETNQCYILNIYISWSINLDRISFIRDLMLPIFTFMSVLFVIRSNTSDYIKFKQIPSYIMVFLMAYVSETFICDIFFTFQKPSGILVVVHPWIISWSQPQFQPQPFCVSYKCRELTDCFSWFQRCVTFVCSSAWVRGLTCRQFSNIKRSLVGNKLADHSDVVRA